MNSEELEQSLRTEFESYLKNVLADMKQEVSEFQKQFEAEFEKHKAQLDEVFQNFSVRVVTDRKLDANFSESVIEHLRLSRDEGARITATAIAEAEEMDKQNAVEAVAPTVSYSEIRDAINDISSKTTQSAILKTLVHQSAQFTPRGAFFIIKNEHLVGWRVFGKEGENTDEQSVREVFFPVASLTVLGESVRSLTTVESSYGDHADDSIYLNKLGFGQPEQMYAVPLVVRGRSVAVLYADRGTQNESVNIEALETLVRVASLTVEILASSHKTQPQEEAGTEEVAESSHQFETTIEETAPVVEESYQFAETKPSKTEVAVEESYSYTPSVEEDYSYKPIEQPAEEFEEPNYQTPLESDNFSFRPSVETKTAPSEFVSKPVIEAAQEVTLAEDFQTMVEAPQNFEPAPVWSPTVEEEDHYSKESSISYETPSYQTFEPQPFEPATPIAESDYAPTISSDYQFESTESFETAPIQYEEVPQIFEAPAFETPSYEAESYAPINGKSYDSVTTENGKSESYVAEPVEAVSEAAVKQPVRSRFSDRNVDLPIEVSEDERRLHNDARRFARLLVSEIKLYNEQKVKEGREGNDLYERLREAIDRSREMYDKRVQPPVAAKFDYFHYELVSNLAEGDSGKLGASYPGSSN